MWQCEKCGREFSKVNQSHFCGEKPKSIDEYIALQSEEHQELLRKVRQVIKNAAPLAEERMSYHMPTFWLGDNLIHFALHKNHLGIYPGDLSRLPFEEKMAEYRKTKGAIQFPLTKPIDLDFIADLTRFRYEQALLSYEQIAPNAQSRKQTDRKAYHEYEAEVKPASRGGA